MDNAVLEKVRCTIHILLKWCQALASSSSVELPYTGGKGTITQWVHAEYIVGSETICPAFTQQVRGGYFSKVPTKVPTR